MITFLNKKEIQFEEKKILDEVVLFLEQHNINYFICYGTLLGAIRHEGFIPWDDDIDIAIPRPDYNKLQKIIKVNNHLTSSIYFHSFEIGNLYLPFTKVYNYNIRVNDWKYKDKYEKYLWIDIFPIDGYPNKKSDIDKLQKIKNKCFKINRLKKMSLKFLFSNKRKFLKNILKLFLKIIIPKKYISKKIINISKKYSYSDSKNVGCLVWNDNFKDIMEKENYEKYIKVKFNNSYYNGLKMYDKYLTQIYGNYMKLPPEDKRVTHNFKAWRVNENEQESKK